MWGNCNFNLLVLTVVGDSVFVFRTCQIQVLACGAAADVSLISVCCVCLLVPVWSLSGPLLLRLYLVIAWHACVWPGVESSGGIWVCRPEAEASWRGCRTGEIRPQVPCASWSDRLPLSAASSGFELEQWKTTPSHHGHSYKNTIFLGNCIPCLPISEVNSMNVLEHTFHFVWIKWLKIGFEGK